MVAAVVIPLLAWLLVTLTRRAVTSDERTRITRIVLFGYGIRLFLFEAVMRRVAFFSHGVAGGDCLGYQDLGSIIAQYWRFGHVHFVTETEMPQLGQAALPCNLLALLEYVDGAPAPLAGTAVNAFLACWTTLLIHRFIRDAGAAALPAERVMLLVLFGPSFLYHTSDTYKDGINAFLVMAGLLNAIRLAQHFDARRLAYLVVSLSFLWFVRHYMVFMCLVPLSLGILGVGKASLPRRLAAGVFLVGVLAALFYSGSGARALDTAAETYNRATSSAVLSYNAGARYTASAPTGSGVITSNYGEALLYTLFAPFPWQSGSMGFQLGKIEALIFYLYMYVVYKNRGYLWRHQRPVLLMLGTFVVPATLAYAATMSNVGLILRQRMPIVIGIAILAGIGYGRHAQRAAAAATPGDVGGPAPPGPRAGQPSFLRSVNRTEPESP